MDFLFDIGRVLLDFDFESSMKRLVACHDQQAFERLMRAVDARDDFESGKITPAEFVANSIEKSGLDLAPEAFISAWREVFTRNQPMWDNVMRLKAAGDHRLILFSNTNAIHCPWIFEAFPEFEAFDGKVLSYEVGTMKPHAAIYEHAIHTFALDPARTRYIDDLPDNIDTGRRFGFRSHLYQLRHHEEFETWLDAELDADASFL